MRPPARTVPRLASDITRSWVAILVALPFIVAPFVFASLNPDLFPMSADGDVSTLVSGIFYVAWTAFCVANVALVLGTFRRADAAELRRWLDATRAPAGPVRRLWWLLNGGGAVTWAITGSLIALAALLDLALSGRDLPVLFIVAGIAVVPASIAVIIVNFAVSHARADRNGALRFPGTDAPVFDDYLYFSIQLTTTFGASDVAITDTRLRRATSAHSMLAFAYNAFVIALLVSAFLNAAR